jgi:hypothetical protein
MRLEDSAHGLAAYLVNEIWCACSVTVIALAFPTNLAARSKDKTKLHKQSGYLILDRAEAKRYLIGKAFETGPPGFTVGYQFVSDDLVTTWGYGGTVPSPPQQKRWVTTKRGLTCTEPAVSINLCFHLVKVGQTVLFRDYETVFDSGGRSRTVYYDKPIMIVKTAPSL